MSFQFYFKLEDIIIGSANIHHIESDTFRPLKNLKYLELWNNPALQFSSDIVQWSSELMFLNLGDCKLKNFDFRALNMLPKLGRLDLSSNKISIISHEPHGNIKMVNDFSSRHHPEHEADGGFMANSSLMNNSGPNIVLEGNPIQIVNPDTIASLCGKNLTLGKYPLSRTVIKNISLGISKSKIGSLSMKSSGIRNITSEMFEPLRNTSLVYLGLLGNRLILYPFVFANLRRVSELDINTCGLTVLEPEYFYGMSALRKIYLYFNNFLSLNPYNATWDINVSELYFLLSYVEKIDEYTFKGLHNLRKLTLVYGNEPQSNMVTIDRENLDDLTIYADNFETVILKTPQLRFFQAEPLSRRQTKYATIYNFQQSKMIEHLKIVKGALSLIYIDKQFELMGHLVNISTLDLNSNSIYEIPSGSFRSIPSLQSLYLNSNGLRTIYSDTFTGLVYLTMLNLEDNSITSIAHDFLKDMKLLTNLQFSSNDLSSLNEDVFADAKMLTTLTLADNDLRWLNENVFANTKVLATLTLADNRFVGFNRTLPSYRSIPQ